LPYQVFHHQGGLFGGDGEELVEAKMRLLVSDVRDCAHHHERNAEVMADMGGVVTLSPANTELAFAAGITPGGVSRFSDYPFDSQRTELIHLAFGIAAAPRQHQIGLQSDNTFKVHSLPTGDFFDFRRGGSQLSSLGIKVIWVETGSIEQIISALQMLAPWSPQPDSGSRRWCW
jgi:hypothetical protein